MPIFVRTERSERLIIPIEAATRRPPTALLSFEVGQVGLTMILSLSHLTTAYKHHDLRLEAWRSPKRAARHELRRWRCSNRWGVVEEIAAVQPLG